MPCHAVGFNAPSWHGPLRRREIVRGPTSGCTNEGQPTFLSQVKTDPFEISEISEITEIIEITEISVASNSTASSSKELGEKQETAIQMSTRNDTLGEEQSFDIVEYLNNKNEGDPIQATSLIKDRSRRTYADMQFVGEATVVPDSALERFAEMKKENLAKKVLAKATKEKNAINQTKKKGNQEEKEAKRSAKEITMRLSPRRYLSDSFIATQADCGTAVRQ